MTSAGVLLVPAAVPRHVRETGYAVPHAPGLDGVRGLAVAAVLAYHLDLPWAGGGFLGVEVFFTLSGFLITQLLTAELRRTGRLDVGAFVRARARRLLPALVACVAATLVTYRLLLPHDAPSLRADALASLAYLQNWQLAFGGMPYSEAFARPSPLLHMWSLSVEGQLYLLWSALFVGVLALLRRWTAIVVTLVLAWLSAVLMAAVHAPDDAGIAYYLTPARASGFLVGAALALAWRPEMWSRRLPRVADALLDAAGLGALTVIVVGFMAASEFDAALYENAGFLRTGLVAAVLIAAASRCGSNSSALMSAGPLVEIGRRSYGLYLYHWPVFVLGRGVPGTGWVRDALCVGLTVLVSEVSYRWWETPIRRGALRGIAARLGRSRPMGASARVVTAAAVAVTVVLGTGTTDTLQQAPATADSDVVADGIDGPRAIDATGPAPDEVAVPPSPPGPVAVGPTGPALVIGDSIALGSAGELQAALGAGTAVDGKVGRQFAASPAIVAAWTTSHDGPVVVALGANGTVSPRDLDAVLEAAGRRRVVLVGVAVSRRWRDGNNTVLRAAAVRHDPQVAFVDWAALVDSHPGVLGPDGVHPGPRGRALLAAAVAEAVRR